jgi:hypothetical protein
MIGSMANPKASRVKAERKGKEKKGTSLWEHKSHKEDRAWSNHQPWRNLGPARL